MAIPQGSSFQNQTASGAKIGSVTVGGLSFGKTSAPYEDLIKYGVVGLVVVGLAIIMRKK